jgi:hypothetical protein
LVAIARGVSAARSSPGTISWRAVLDLQHRFPEGLDRIFEILHLMAIEGERLQQRIDLVVSVRDQDP